MYKRFLTLLAIKYVNSQISGYVIGGDYSNMLMYPHSVFLDISGNYPCVCGGSILNQAIVLSAAHCFDKYRRRFSDKVLIRYGGTSVSSMSYTVMLYYILHDEYNEKTMKSDISLLRCKTPIRLGRLVKRIAIMRRPPREKLAYVSGWGSENNNQDLPKKIKHTKQDIRTTHVCRNYLSLPDGTFCAGPINGEGHPAVGDSGGALVVKKFIQIGIVSYKEEHSSLVVYTNVSYYYDWIRSNAVFAYCAPDTRL